MTDILFEFAFIIAASETKLEGERGRKQIQRCWVTFTNGTRLVAYESRYGAKFKYGYQWMDANDETIFRWDNTPHYSQFATFPAHRHVGPAEVAEPFAEVELRDVLRFIADNLSPTSN